MKLFKQLFFDRELVDSLKTADLDADRLYIALMNGKITLGEYVAALRNLSPVR